MCLDAVSMDKFGVLYLKLLFDFDFKKMYTVYFVRCYQRYFVKWSDQEPVRKAVVDFLDRTVCQLFHNPERALELVKTEKLILVLARTILRFFETMKDVDRVSLCKNPIMSSRLYARMFSTLQSVLGHDEVMGHVLSDPDTSDVLVHVLLKIMCVFEALDPQKRKIGSHVAYEHDAWTHAFHLNLEVMILSETLMSGFRTQRTSTDQIQEDVSQLFKRSLRFLVDGAEMTELRKSCYDLSRARSEMFSFHCPLHRMTVLLMLETSRQSPRVELEDIFADAKVPQTAIAMMMEGPMMVMSFVHQIMCGRWRRNGRVMFQQLHYHFSRWWSPYALDLDFYYYQRKFFFAFSARENAGKRIFGNFFEMITNSSKSTTPSPSLSACAMIVSALRMTSRSLEAM